MDEWNNSQNLSPRFQAVAPLLQKVETLDAEYLGEKIDREEWITGLKEIDGRLAVAGLRLAARPWEKR